MKVNEEKAKEIKNVGKVLKKEKQAKKLRFAFKQLLEKQQQYPKEDFFIFRDALNNFKVIEEANVLSAFWTQHWKYICGTGDLATVGALPQELLDMMYQK